MLRDNGSAGALVTWNEFKPKSKKQRLDHYYTFSPGMAPPSWLKTVVNIVFEAVGTLVGAPGAGTALTQGFYNSVANSANDRRRGLDSAREKDRINNAYVQQIARDPYDLKNATSFSIAQIDFKLSQIATKLAEIAQKCRNRDSAG